MIYIQLFVSFLQIGAFSFGGGYAALPLIQDQIVTKHGWLGMAEFTDLITISQMTPGPIAINAATFVGTKLAGPLGAAAATAGCILPSCILALILAKMYLKYRKMSGFQTVMDTLRPAVVALVAGAGVSILTSAFFGEAVPLILKNVKWDMVLIFALCLYLLQKKKVNPIVVMMLAGIIKAGESYILRL